MATTIYRVCRRIYASLDGEGARRVGGRWNSPGRSVVYMAQSVALAVLENLVHMSRQDYPTGYVVVAATVPDHVRIIEHLRYLDAMSTDAAREPYGQETGQIIIMPHHDLRREGIWTRALLLSAGAAIAGPYNLRPEQNLAHHTEDTENEDQFHSARTQPEPRCVSGSLDSFQ
jgi:hypothetical protein